MPIRWKAAPAVNLSGYADDSILVAPAALNLPKVPGEAVVRRMSRVAFICGVRVAAVDS
jgi:hypothetical protein